MTGRAPVSDATSRRSAVRFAGTIAFVLLALLFAGETVDAAPRADLWPRWEAYDARSNITVNHGAWDLFLTSYRSVENGIARIDYDAVSAADHAILDQYVTMLEAQPVTRMTRNEQFALWVNLYNAATVLLILEHYPVESIRDIRLGGIFSSGPWDEKFLSVEGESLSLNDIEHRILRPVWRDRRIHFVVNCASIGCPNIPPRAITASTVEAALREAERSYLTHPRALSVAPDGSPPVVTASSIFSWYSDDFPRERDALLEYWAEHAAPETATALRDLVGERRVRIEYVYDWSLNRPEPR